MSDSQVAPAVQYCADGGVMTYIDDEYGWDGDYEVYRCTCPKRRHYVELPG